MMYRCPKCGLEDPAASPLSMWRGCKRCGFGTTEFAEAHWDPNKWVRLMRKKIRDLEVEKLCKP